MKTKNFALGVKSVGEDGTFEGYGSVFGNADSYGDIVLPGAFTKSLARHVREKSNPLMLWQHNPDYPIGVWDELAEDTKGLYCKGRLLRGVQKADEAYILLKAGALRGLSIGYEEVKSQPAGGKLNLIELDLWEISPVSFPANRRAGITSVKSEAIDAFARRLRGGDPPPVKEFEDLLREAGVPRSMAVQIASVGYAKAVRSESEGKANIEGLTALRSAVSAFFPHT